MDPTDRTDVLFKEALKLGLVNPINGDALPTHGMIVEAISHAVEDAAWEADSLAVLVRRLTRRVRQKDPDDPVATQSAAFLKRVGRAGSTLR